MLFRYQCGQPGNRSSEVYILKSWLGDRNIENCQYGQQRRSERDDADLPGSSPFQCNSTQDDIHNQQPDLQCHPVDDEGVLATHQHQGDRAEQEYCISNMGKDPGDPVLQAR